MMSGGNAGASGQHQHHLKRRPPAPPPASAAAGDHERQQQRKLLRLSVQHQDQDDDVAAGVVPPVTVALDGRCICHRVHLGSHSGYRSLAVALRRMFVDTDAADADDDSGSAGRSADADADHGLDLSNAVPGHVVAYEDMEDDLLLAGDLNWKDFVRVAKRIRIIPAKPSNRRKQ